MVCGLAVMRQLTFNVSLILVKLRFNLVIDVDIIQIFFIFRQKWFKMANELHYGMSG